MNKFKSFILFMVILISTFGFSIDRKSTTTTTDPVGNVTIQTFFGVYPFESKTFKGAGLLLSTTTSCYNITICSPSSVTLPITQKDLFTTLSGAGTSRASVTYNTYGLVTDSKAYGFGPTLIGEEATTYCILGNGGNIRSAPCAVVTKDAVGSTINSETYTYTNNGNLLTRSALIGGTTRQIASYTYTGKGIMASYTNASGATTTYNNTACSGAAASSVIHPLIGTELITWDCSGGVPLTNTDVNGSTYTVAYGDPFWRSTRGVDSLGHVTARRYTPTTGETITDTNDNLVTYNVAGEPINSQIRQSKGSGQYDTVTSHYDTMGRVIGESMPCVSSGPCSGTEISFSYDAGSVPTTTLSDSLGGATTMTVQKGDVTVLLTPAPTGEGIKGKQFEYDGVGRLLSICEITSGSGSSSCGQRVAQTGFLTTYTYDGAGNIITITQGAQTRSYTYDNISRILTETNPESGTTTYTYDTDGCGTAIGELVKSVDANGNTTCYNYDSTNRLISKTYSGPNATDSVFYVYDAATVNGHVMANAKGRLAEAYTCTSCPGTKKTDIGFSYDIMGATTYVYESSTNSGGYYHIGVTFYANQTLHTLHMDPSVIPDITYGIDGEGRTSTAIAGTTPLMSSTVRGPSSEVNSLTFGTSDVDTYGYDALRRITQYALSANGASAISTLSYNANGTLASRQTVDPFKAANNETCAYTYDRLVRLSTANCGTVNQSFDYDRYGNITKSGTFSFSPTYDTATNRITANTYDADGNVLTDGTRTYTWDAEGKMLSVTGVTSILYNAMGQMAERTIGSTHQQYVYFPSGEKLALMNGQALTLARIPLPGGALAVYTSGGLQYYAHVDAMGSTRLTTATDRTVSNDLAYAPFGEPYNNSGVDTSVLSFTGFNQDTVAGLYDSASRKYDPAQSRWVSSDRYNAQDLGDPQSFNLYSYALNNPLLHTDPSGAILDGNEPVYAPGVDPANGETPGQESQRGGLNNYYIGDGSMGGASGDWPSKWESTFNAIDPLGLGAGFDVPEEFLSQFILWHAKDWFVGPLDNSDQTIMRIANAIQDSNGTGPHSIGSVLQKADRILDWRAKTNSLFSDAHGLKMAFGKLDGSLPFQDPKIWGMDAIKDISGLHRFATVTGSVPYFEYASGIADPSLFGIGTKSAPNALAHHFRLMDEIRQQGGMILFNMEGIVDSPAMINKKTFDNVVQMGSRNTKFLVHPDANSWEAEHLRYLRDNWTTMGPRPRGGSSLGVSFKQITIFYERTPYSFRDTPVYPPGWVPW